MIRLVLSHIPKKSADATSIAYNTKDTPKDTPKDTLRISYDTPFMISR